MTTARSTTGWLAVLLAGTLALPAAAGADAPRFGAPVVVRMATTLYVGEPAVDVAPSGDLVIAWDDQERRTAASGVVIRRGTVAGALGPSERVGASGYGPSVAAGRAGGAAAIWATFGRHGTRRVQVAVARGRARFGAPQTLTTVRANVTSPQVLATGDRYVAIWWQGIPGAGRHAVRYAVSDADGRFGAARTLAPDTGPLTGVSAARGPDGAITAAWGTPLGRTPPTNQQLAYARLAPGAARFGPVAGLRAAAADQSAETVGIRVASGPGGTALTWQEEAHLPQLLRTASLTAKAPAAPVTVLALDSTDLGKRFAGGPALALPGSGLPAVAAWTVGESPGGESEAIAASSVFAADRGADGGFGAGAQVSAPGTIATNPAAAATRSSAVVAWATGAFPRCGLQYVARNGAGAFGPVRALTAGRSERGAVLASSPSAVVAVWVARGARAGRDPDAGSRAVALAILRDRG